MSNNVLEAFYSLGKNINKPKGQSTDETNQGVVSEKYPELTLDIDNDTLGQLTSKWQKKWNDSEVYNEWKKSSEENERYWLGKHFQKAAVDKSRPMVDNAIFESLETYLPQVINQDPEPEVDLDHIEDEKDTAKVDFADQLQSDVANIIQKIKFRNKLRKGARHWAIYITAVAKLTWDIDQDIPTMKLVRMAKIILDPDATVDEDGYTGEYIGEHRKLQASKIINILKTQGGEEGAVKKITELVGDNLGTEVGFIEYWTDEYMCWTLDDEVLLKKKNMHWNYPKAIEAQAQEMPSMDQQIPEAAPGSPMLPQLQNGTMEESAEPAEQAKPLEPQEEEEETTDFSSIDGLNHLKKPKKPYLLLSFFNLGNQPIDNTSLIGQNLSSQDLLNKRNKQTDKNIDSMNNGMVVSLGRSGLTQDQAKGVTAALRKGGVVTIPDGAVNEAIARMSADALPADVYNDKQDVRNRIKDIFGTRGSSAAGVDTEKTVRGKYLNHTLDTSRTGGGISEVIEQWAEDITDYLVQMLYVYDDRYANGQPKPPVIISIKPGSTLPKDKTTIANQAISLAEAGKMSTLDMFKRLDMPNAEEMAANVWLEVNAPEVLFANDQRVQQVIQQRQQAAQAAAQSGAAAAVKPPSESINFKDLPPEGQAQMAKKVGIDLHPEAIAAHEELKSSNKAPATMPDTSKTGIINNQ